MRMSCNGCRVLRKGCSEGCTIRPCLQWIKSPEAQANATVFIAKFYGRAGFINLISAGPDRLRPAIFRSLLYEACGRILNPIYGSAGLLWSGNWPLCQAAVDSVLKGEPVVKISPDSAVSPASVPGFKLYDIRHIVKTPERAAGNLHRVAAKSRTNFKHPGFNPSASGMLLPAEIREVEAERRSATSGEGSDVSHVTQGEPKVALDLTLRLDLAVGKAEMKLETAGAAGSCQAVELGLSLAAA